MIQLCLNWTVLKNAIAAGKTYLQIQFASQMWAARPHLANIFKKLLDQKTFYFACGSILATNPNHKKEDSRPFSQNRLSSVADVCASPEAQGMDILDNISHGGVFSRYIAQNLYGRKNFRYNLISFSKTAAYSFAPISACISISTSCVGRFSSLMPIQVQHGRLSLKNSE